MDRTFRRKTLCPRCKEAIILTLKGDNYLESTETCLCGELPVSRWLLISPYNLARYLSKDFTEITPHE